MSLPRLALPLLLSSVSPLLVCTAKAQDQTPPNTVPPPVPAPSSTPVGPQNGTSPPGILDAPPNVPRPKPPARTPVPPSERNFLNIENADTASGGDNGEPYVLAGNVRLRYNGYHATCDRVSFNRQEHLVTFEGRVKLESDNPTVYADYVQIDTRTNDFVAREGRTIIPAGQLGPDVIEPVLLQGRTLRRKGNTLTALQGQLTTCDFPNPHYKFGFRQADLIPNDRIVLRDTTLYRYDKKIARTQYLVIPIRERSTASIPPNVGRTDEEGYFIKFAVGYVLNAALPGLLRIDLMEKKGIGLGFDQAYRIGGVAAGTVLLYQLHDRNRGVDNLNGRINHQQYIGDSTATIASDFQNNSYQSLSSNSKTGQTTVTLNRNVDAHDTSVSLTQANNDYTTNQSSTTSYTLSQTEHFGTANSITLRLNGTDSTNKNLGLVTSTSGRTEQNGDLQANLRLGIFDTTLKANKSLQLKQKGDSSGSASFSGTQRLPDLTLTTDTDRFSKSGSFTGLIGKIPGSYTLGYGRYLENVTSFTSGTAQNRNVTTGRFLFGFTPRDKQIPITPGGNLALQLGGNFQQTVYREDAAQYVLTGRSNLVQKLGEQSSFNLAYNYLRSYGGSPEEFRLDQTGATNNLNANVSINTYRTRLSLISGYDILESRSDPIPGIKKTPWQNVAVQLGLRPSPVLQTRFTTAYDINHGKLLDVTNNNRIRGRNSFALDTGLRYDPRRNRFVQVTDVLTIPIFSRDLTLSALTSYNGVTYKFDYKQFYLTRSFHDYELLFTYIDQPYGFRTQKGFNFSIRLKAFPTLRPPTTGQYGTPLDTGTGDTF